MAWTTADEFNATAHQARRPARKRRPVRSRVFVPWFPRPIVMPTISGRVRRRRRRRARSWLFSGEAVLRRYYHDARGRYRVFNAAVYRFYRSNSGPPAEDDTPFATSASLPYTTSGVSWTDGTWYISVSKFDGVLDSGFLPLGPNGERYLRLDIASGATTYSPPANPKSVDYSPSAYAEGPGPWLLAHDAGGVVRVEGFYQQTADERATEWVIAYTTDGATPSIPPADDASTTIVYQTIGGSGLAVLDYALPAQSHGVTVKVRLMVRRFEDPDYVYSENSEVLTTTADAQGPAAPPTGEPWAGRLPEDF